MSTDANKAILKRFWEEIFNEGNASVVDELVAKDYLNHDSDPGRGAWKRGAEAVCLLAAQRLPGFLHFTVQKTVAAEDTVVTRWQAMGDHGGEFMGVPPTGKRVSVTGMAMHRVDNGKVVEAWNNWDGLGMLTQLGVLPGPGGGGS